MKNIIGGGQIVAAIALIILGFLVQSAIFEFLLDIVGWILIIAGVILAIQGLLKAMKKS